MKKLISLMLMFAVIVNIITSTSIATGHSFSFNDIPEGIWYYDEVKTVYESGIMEGKSKDRFDPKANMTRAEFVTVLCRLSADEYEGKGTSLTFSDTKTNAWYADYVGWGVETDMVKGLPGNKFAPNQAVSRQEMAVFIDRFISYMNIELNDNSKIDRFNDSSDIASYSIDAVETMRKSGIITGDQNGNFNPTKNASRAEVATVVSRLLSIINYDSGTNVPITPEKNGEFNLYSEDNAPLTYYLYVPKNYIQEDEYPLLVYTRGLGEDSIDTVDVCFSHEGSPAHNSIVLVPNTNSEGDYKKIDELIDYVKLHYSVDNSRVYLIALGNEPSTFEAWQMLLDRPEIVSAVLFVQGISATIGNSLDGSNVLADDIVFHRMPHELKDLPFYYVHCLDDLRPDIGLSPEYGGKLYEALQNSKFTNVYLMERTTGYDTICDNFITKDDITLLEWLFAQRRESK